MDNWLESVAFRGKFIEFDAQQRQQEQREISCARAGYCELAVRAMQYHDSDIALTRQDRSTRTKHSRKD